jgi:hypothetical protein
MFRLTTLQVFVNNNLYFARKKFNCLDYLLFVGYLVLFTWLVTKLKFYKNSQLNNSQLIIIFLLKVMAGIFYGWVGVYYGNMAKMVDTWSYHYLSLQEFQLLKDNPGEYFTNLIYYPYADGYLKFFGTDNSYWNDLKVNFFIKVLSLFNIFSLGNYYINVIFYSFITMIGPIAMYRVMIDVYPGKKLQVILATFLVPSFLYWTSGLHKEGFLFLGLSLITYCIYFGLKENRWSIKRILVIIFSMILILALRNFLIVLFAPAIFAWLLAAKWPQRGLTVFFLCYLVFGILFFTTRYVNEKFDFPAAVVTKQGAFMAHSGGSEVDVRRLEPTVISFIINAPQAISLSALRPYPSDVSHILSLAAAVEIFLLLLLFTLFLLTNTHEAQSRNFIIFCAFFAFSLLFTIGFTVNFIGAIVRYRSIAFPFLLTPVICQINWRKLQTMLALS